MRKVNWDNVQEAQDFARPVPGGYVARITNVEDKEEKEYLRIEWDFVDKPYEGSNLSAFDRLGFWPLSFVRSYKEKSLSFFKAFKTQLEASNPVASSSAWCWGRKSTLETAEPKRPASPSARPAALTPSAGVTSPCPP